MNLRELSELLGVSQTTVSRALNGYPEVNEATRARVARRGTDAQLPTQQQRAGSGDGAVQRDCPCFAVAGRS